MSVVLCAVSCFLSFLKLSGLAFIIYQKVVISWTFAYMQIHLMIMVNMQLLVDTFLFACNELFKSI